jgi:uncharacterized membrane protein
MRVWLVEHVTRTNEVSHAYNCLVGIVDIRRALGRPRHRWEGNIKMCVEEKTCKMIGRNVLATRVALTVVRG